MQVQTILLYSSIRNIQHILCRYICICQRNYILIHISIGKYKKQSNILKKSSSYSVTSTNFKTLYFFTQIKRINFTLLPIIFIVFEISKDACISLKKLHFLHLLFALSQFYSYEIYIPIIILCNIFFFNMNLSGDKSPTMTKIYNMYIILYKVCNKFVGVLPV